MTSEAREIIAALVRASKVGAKRTSGKAVSRCGDTWSPLPGNILTDAARHEFEIANKGWYLIAVRDALIVGATRVPYRAEQPEFRPWLSVRSRQLMHIVVGVETEADPDRFLFGAYHYDGRLSDWQVVSKFVPVIR